jgi:hypothetical protein
MENIKLFKNWDGVISQRFGLSSCYKNKTNYMPLKFKEVDKIMRKQL